MSTLLSTCVTNARTTLLESTARYWTDNELVVLANDAIKDLWAAIIDLYQDHIVTIDDTSMSIASGANSITGVPADLFRIVMIQPRTLGTSSSNQGLVFQPRTLLHPDFVQAQASPPVCPRHTVIFYAVINAGAPVAAPTIRLAPAVSAAVLLSVWYNPIIPTKIISDANPIPGESDKAITEYIIAFARAKEKEDRAPDAEHLSIYATEKRKILIALTPRSVQEPEVVEAFFNDYM